MNTQTPKNIFVPNFSPSNDYKPAAKYGEVVIMTRGLLYNTPSELHAKFRNYFSTANEGDILMYSGSHVACCAAYAEWCKRFPNSRNIMIYNKHTNDYDILTVSE